MVEKLLLSVALFGVTLFSANKCVDVLLINKPLGIVMVVVVVLFVAMITYLLTNIQED